MTYNTGDIPHLKPNAVVLENVSVSELAKALELPESECRPGVVGFNEQCFYRLVSVPDWSTLVETPLGPGVKYQQYALIERD